MKTETNKFTGISDAALTSVKEILDGFYAHEIDKQCPQSVRGLTGMYNGWAEVKGWKPYAYQHEKKKC